MTLEEELAEILATLPTPAVVEPVWYTIGQPGDPLPSTFPVANDRVYVRMSKPTGGRCAVPYTNVDTYLAKSFQWTGEWADYDAWSVAVAREHKWHGFDR